MKLMEGKETEYKKRHDEIWPELVSLLKKQGIEDYSIFLDEGSGQLFGCLAIAAASQLDRLREEPLMWKWWNYMKDIMETKPDGSPATTPLREVFYLA